MNVFTFSGNLGKDAERRSVGASTVANFSVPVKAGFGDKQTTTWINCAVWGKRAEGGLVDLLTKGTPVCVSGELSQREWTNQSGEIKTSLVTLMGKGQAKESVEPDAPLDDHIPF